MLEQHQGQQASHHQGLQREILDLCKVCTIQMYVENIVITMHKYKSSHISVFQFRHGIKCERYDYILN